MCRSVSGGACRWTADGGFRFAAHEAAQFVGSRPTASSFLACPRKEPKKGTRGCAPATPAPPPVGLRPKSAAPCHGSANEPIATSQPPRRGRNASADESPEPFRECAWGRHGRFNFARMSHGEAENCAATPRTRAECANARNGRCFPPCVPGEPSGLSRWVRPQPELSLQLVNPWGVTVTGGFWQGVSRGFLRGRWSPLRRTFGSFSSVRKGTRGARRNAQVILAACKAAIPVLAPPGAVRQI